MARTYSNLRAIRGCIALCGAAALAACQQISTPIEPIDAMQTGDAVSTDGAQSDVRSDGGTSDAPTVQDARVDAGGDSARDDSSASGSPQEFGGVKLMQYSPGGSPSVSIGATFVHVPQNATMPGIQQFGTCTVYQLINGFTFESAGTITVSYSAASMFTLPPVSDSSYGGVSSGEGLEAQQEVFVRATGDTVPAFSETVVFPAAMSGTNPAQPTDTTASIAIPRTGFDVTWTPDASITVDVILVDTQTQSDLECRFDGSAGTGTVPAEALRAFNTSGVAIVLIGSISSAPIPLANGTGWVSAENVAVEGPGVLQ